MRPLLPLLALVLAGCASPAATGTVAVTATIGPTQPVCQADRPCSGPYDGALELVRADGKAVQSFTTANGTATLHAAAGTYTIRHTDGHGWPACHSDPFTVTAGATVQAAVECDSGIR
jgi:hypothetical protein